MMKVDVCSVEDVRLKASEQKNKAGLDILIIDYLQLLTSSAEFGNRQEEITRILNDLKAIAEELAVTIIVLAQLSRSVEDKHDERPNINDFHAIGQVEARTDILIFLYSDSYYNNKPSEVNSTEIIMPKTAMVKPVRS